MAILKSVLPEDMREPSKLYSSAFRLLCEYILKIDNSEEYKNVIVITDALSSNTKRKYLTSPLKTHIKSLVAPVNLTYSLHHHTSAGDINLQITDYFCWAIQRSLERGDNRSLVLIKDSLRGIWRVGEDGEPVHKK